MFRAAGTAKAVHLATTPTRSHDAAPAVPRHRLPAHAHLQLRPDRGAFNPTSSIGVKVAGKVSARTSEAQQADKGRSQRNVACQKYYWTVDVQSQNSAPSCDKNRTRKTSRHSGSRCYRIRNRRIDEHKPPYMTPGLMFTIDNISTPRLPPQVQQAPLLQRALFELAA